MIVYSASNFNIKTTEVNQLNVNEKIYWIEKNFKNSIFDEEMRKSVAKMLTQSKIISVF
jgi:L-fucose isomerase-like protein